MSQLDSNKKTEITQSFEEESLMKKTINRKRRLPIAIKVDLPKKQV